MADDIHKFLDDYFVEHGLKRADDAVRYVQLIIANDALETGFSNLFAGHRSAVFRLKNWYESQRIATPEVGNIVVFTDFFGAPQAVVLVTRVETVLYKDFTPKMASAAGFDDGNGNGDVEKWKTSRHKMIVADCEASDITFNEEIEIMATWFDKLYPN